MRGPCVNERSHHGETETHREPAASQPDHVTLRAKQILPVDRSLLPIEQMPPIVLFQGNRTRRDRRSRRGAALSATSGPLPSSAPGPAPDVFDALPHAWKRSTRGREDQLSPDHDSCVLDTPATVRAEGDVCELKRFV